jgi:group I intron endonuclease
MLEFLNLKEGDIRKSGIYFITTSINDKFYIGSAKDFSVRFSRHKYNLKNNRHENQKLQNFVNKYGSDKIIFNVLKFCSIDLLLKEEQFYINTLNPYYNICKIAGNSIGTKREMITKNKMKDIHLEKKINKVKNGTIKLTTDDVYEIKRMFVLGYLTKDIKSKFNIAKETIYGIIHKRHWKNVPDYIIKDSDIILNNKQRWNFKKYDKQLVETILEDYYINKLTGKEIRFKYNLGTNIYKILRGELYKEIHNKIKNNNGL